MLKTIDEFTVIIWNQNNRSRFVSMGYIFTKYGDEFQVKVRDLSHGALARVGVCCDRCEKRNEINFKRYLESASVKIFGFGHYLCWKCSRNSMKRTTETFRKEVEELTDGEFELRSEYIASNVKVLMFHTKCGAEFEIDPSGFLGSPRCSSCSRFRKRTHEDFVREVNDLVGDEYSILSSYITRQDPVSLRHNICNHTYEVKPYCFIAGQRCPKCNRSYKKTTEQFKKEVYNLVGNDYVVLDEYKGNKIKLKIKHNECGNVYYVAPLKFLQGKRCPPCRESKGERKIRCYLIKNNIKYIRQFTFDDCKNKRKLIFDFAILDEFDKVKLLIEYDGELHYKVVEQFGGLDQFNKTNINDHIKTEYCLNKNIKLIRIPYWEIDDIDLILNEEMNYE